MGVGGEESYSNWESQGFLPLLKIRCDPGINQKKHLVEKGNTDFSKWKCSVMYFLSCLSQSLLNSLTLRELEKNY